MSVEMVLETDRLLVRRFTAEDTAFIVELLNQPSFLKNIGDRGVRNVEDARRYLLEGPLAMYERIGFGLCGVVLKTNRALIGMCGVLKRDALEFPDLGFAFLPAYWSAGYAREAAGAVLTHARKELGLGRILAITAPDNPPSIALLTKLGFRFEQMIRMTPNAEESRLFISDP